MLTRVWRAHLMTPLCLVLSVASGAANLLVSSMLPSCCFCTLTTVTTLHSTAFIPKLTRQLILIPRHPQHVFPIDTAEGFRSFIGT